MSPKTCERCGTEYHRRRHPSGKLASSTQWRRRRFCSVPCSNAAMVEEGARSKGGHRRQELQVPIERIQPLAKWLAARYGSGHKAAKALGVSHGQFNKWVGARNLTRVSRHSAALLTEAVLAHKRKRDPWSPFEVEPAYVGPAIRESIPDPRREKSRESKRRQRANKATTKFCDCGTRIIRAGYDMCHECEREMQKLTPKERERHYRGWNSRRSA